MVLHYLYKWLISFFFIFIIEIMVKILNQKKGDWTIKHEEQ
jgi:hypothetical protein